MRAMDSITRASSYRFSMTRRAVGVGVLVTLVACADSVTAPVPATTALATRRSAPAFTMTDLGTTGEATAIALNGLVVGYRYVSTGSIAVVWKDGVATDLAAANSAAFDLNSRGQIVGSVPKQFGFAAVLWEKGVPTVLPTLGGNYDTRMRSTLAGASSEAASPPALACNRKTLWACGSITYIIRT